MSALTCQETWLDSRKRLDQYAVWEYRAFIVENAGLSDAWRNTAWMDEASCRDRLPTTEMCETCPVVDECLAVALVTNDHAPLRAGLDASERLAWFEVLDEAAQELDPWLAERRAQLQDHRTSGVRCA